MALRDETAVEDQREKRLLATKQKKKPLLAVLRPEHWQGAVSLWTWRESNPRPNEEIIRFLHAYLRLGFSCTSKTEATNLCLIL